MPSLTELKEQSLENGVDPRKVEAAFLVTSAPNLDNYKGEARLKRQLEREFALRCLYAWAKGRSTPKLVTPKLPPAEFWDTPPDISSSSLDSTIKQLQAESGIKVDKKENLPEDEVTPVEAKLLEEFNEIVGVMGGDGGLIPRDALEAIQEEIVMDAPDDILAKAQEIIRG